MNSVNACNRLICRLGRSWVWAVCLAASNAVWAQDDPYRLQVDVRQEGGAFNTQASFKLPLSLCQAWRYITDYDAALQIPGVVSSKTTPLGPGKVRVERGLRETFLLFPIRMRTVLDFTESAQKGTDFVQVEGESKSHKGSWRLEPTGDGTVFRYQATSEPDSTIPMAVIRYFLDKRLRSSFAAMAQQGAQRAGTDCPS